MNMFSRRIIGLFYPAIMNSGECKKTHFDEHSISYLYAKSVFGDITTTIIIRDKIHLVLNGDHRKNLIKISKNSGLDGCIRYFAVSIDEANQNSDHFDLVDQEDDVFNHRAVALLAIGQKGIERIKKHARTCKEKTNLQAFDFMMISTKNLLLKQEVFY